MNKRIYVDQFRQAIATDCGRYVGKVDTRIIADMITRSELMGVSSHGLHYYLHSIRPLVETGRINASEVTVRGNVVSAEGDGGVGFRNLEACLKKASGLAARSGSSVLVLKNPGKVGALRLYCQSIMDRGQLLILMKNTAATVGLPGSKRPIIGTNPLCIGLPDSAFIYDSSISTIATNRMRLNAKRDEAFSNTIGLDAKGKPTKDATDILEGEGMLLPFSTEDYAFKGFFLGVVIESIAAMAGGKTSIRVGKNKGARLYSDEGMFGFIVDRKVFPNYDNYLKELPLLFNDLKTARIRLPNSKKPRKTLTVLRRDWQELIGS